MVTAARPRARRARLWWRVHQWAGLQVCLFLTFVFLTGTLAVFSYEIDWALRPAMWVDPARADGDAGWGDYGAAVLKQVPSAEIIAVNAPLHPAAAVDVVVREGTRLPHHVYVHPGTGEVLDVEMARVGRVRVETVRARLSIASVLDGEPPMRGDVLKAD